MPERGDGQAPDGPLAGIRVLEFGSILAVPTCGHVLADMGAEVVKVEPRTGDALRNNTPIIPRESRAFVLANRGKRSICVDITREESRAIIEPLVARSDIVLMSLKLTDLPRYGLAYDDLRRINPAVIYLEHSAFGPNGPYGQVGGYDVIVQAMSGLAAITARSNANDGDAPESVRPAYMDVATGYISALAVVAALRHRDRTGVGQRVRTSLLSTALTLGAPILNWFAAVDPAVWETAEARIAELRSRGAGFEEQREVLTGSMLRGTVGNAYYRHYRTKDGFVSVGCLSEQLRERFRAVTGIPDPQLREGFDLAVESDAEEARAFRRACEALVEGQTTAYWLETFSAAGVPCGPLNFPMEALRDPQVTSNDFIIELDHTALGPYKTHAPPFRMDETPFAPVQSSPPLDADTDVVLAEAGVSPEAIAALRRQGVIGKVEG